MLDNVAVDFFWGTAIVFVATAASAITDGKVRNMYQATHKNKGSKEGVKHKHIS